jgi:endoglucanase
MDAIRGKSAYLPNWDLARKLMRFMDDQNLPYQREIVIGLSTALSLVPFMNNGIKTAAVSLPIRYHHTAVELADVRDLTHLLDVVQALLINNVPE